VPDKSANGKRIKIITIPDTNMIEKMKIYPNKKKRK